MTSADPAPTSGPALAPGGFTLDPAGSSVAIANKTMWGLVTVRGTFSKLSGTGTIDADGTVHGELRIAAASIDTKHAKRDTHLRSGDFFDVEHHPDLVFTVTGGTLGADGSAKLDATLEVAGITRPLELAAEVRTVDERTVDVVATTTIDRSNFGIDWNKAGMLKPITDVTVTARFTRAAA